MPTCLNLRKLFEDRRFRFGYDESYKAERPEFRKLEKNWLTHILCRHGHIGVWGGDFLVACTDKNGGVAGQLKSFKFIKAAQDGVDGVNAVFHLKHFDKVVEVMVPRRKRKLSEEQRVKAAEVLAKYRKKHREESCSEAQICDGVPSLDTECLP
jgi:hypothetical protein